MCEKKALIAMSGGVDSSVAAWLTMKAGYTCMGATMQLYDHLAWDSAESTCCSLDDVSDARAAAYKLGIPFHVFNFKQSFQDAVLDNFVTCYACGLTPNPCIECNRHLKFSRFLERARLLGCDYIVTGHYARIRKDEATGRYLLYKAADPAKDQSYVLYMLTQEQLSHTLFPLGELTKAQVREIAQNIGFCNAGKKDSQDICFVPDGDYMDFIRRYTGKEHVPGDFLDQTGKVVGRHRGAAGYTLGQRKGLGLAMGEPVYVCGKNMAENTVTVGPESALFRKELLADHCNWIPFARPDKPLRVSAKARYRHAEQPATVYPEADGSIRVAFDSPQRAMTPGQAIVFYDGDLVVGGATIKQIL